MKYLIFIVAALGATTAAAIVAIPDEHAVCARAEQTDRCVLGELTDFESCESATLIVEQTFGNAQSDVGETETVALDLCSHVSLPQDDVPLSRALVCSSEDTVQTFVHVDANGFYDSWYYGPVDETEVANALLDEQICEQTFEPPQAPERSFFGGCEVCNAFSIEAAPIYFLFGVVFLVGDRTRRSRRG